MRKSALAALALITASGLYAAAENRPPREVTLGVGGFVEGTMQVEGVNGCYILATGTVISEDLGGTVDGAVNFWDDGNFIAGYGFEVPADGGVHGFCVVHQVTVPILQGAAGIGVYLEDEVGLAATTTYDSNGSFNDVTEVCTGEAPVCPGASVVAVPTLERRGLLLLVAFLAVAAFLLIARRRTATR